MPRNPVKWGKSWNKAINHETYSKAFRLPRQDAYLKEVSISDILEAKMKRTIGERLKRARKDAKIRQGCCS